MEDALDPVAKVLVDAEQMLADECLNESARTCIRAGIAVASGRKTGDKENALRYSAEARQWLKEARDFNRADADRKIAQIAAEHEAKKDRAAKRAAMRDARRKNLRVV